MAANRMIKERVLFLDFDGVVATSGSYKRRYRHIWNELGRTGRLPTGKRLQQFVESVSTVDGAWELVFNPEMCERVQRLLVLADADYVLSTSWRNMFPQEELEGFLAFNGLSQKAVGITPSVGLDVFDRHKRGNQILRFCQEHGIDDARRIIILEDEEDCAPFESRVIRTSFNGPHAGFTEKHFLRAKRLWGLPG